ncbi:MerR family transcriptional regulator [Nocardia sp. NPDC058176]|uniref:MerR family transcriptional regulator n=1 Tax=Nocardia sp. NPDC058176 TaxID=3346368 RepID=UPI0036DB60A4
MLSSELADLAGVTVRTLRHYHQIGLLPEPPRSSAGYRRYDVGHLVRLLRITRMTALGIPLSALPAVLDDPTTAAELLDDLDRRAAAEIEQLTARRASIAALRRTGAPPDLPPELSPWHSAPAADTPAEMVRYEREQLVLLGHLLGDDGPARIAALFGEIDAEMAAAEPLMARFYALPPDAPEAEISSLVQELAAYLAPLLQRLAALTPLDPQASALIGKLSEQTLNPAQHRVLDRIDHLLVPLGKR